MGLIPLNNALLDRFVGPPMQESFQKYYGFKRQDALDAANLFRDNYKRYSLFDGELYPGIISMLQSQKNAGIKISVATNKSHENAMAILDYFGISEFCEFMLGSDNDGKLSKADIIDICLSQLRADKERTIYIGDSFYDSEGAEMVGIDFMGVTYGFGFKDMIDFENVRYVAVCKNVAEINKYLGINTIL